jgi:phage pi2 protein 07
MDSPTGTLSIIGGIDKKLHSLQEITMKPSRSRNLILRRTGEFIKGLLEEVTEMEKHRDEFFEKNNELSIEFSKYVLEHPEMEDLLSEERIIVFLPEFDSDLRDFNTRMGRDIEGEGGKVLYVKMKRLSPKISSRLIGVEIAT